MLKSRKKRWVCLVFPTGGVCTLYCTFHGYEVGECNKNDVCTCHKHQTTMFRLRVKILKKMLLSTTTLPPRIMPKRVLFDEDWMTNDSNDEDEDWPDWI